MTCEGTHRDCACDGGKHSVPPALRQTCKTVFWPVVLSRIWVALWVYAGHFQASGVQEIPGGYAGVPHLWLNAWTAFDSRHFLSIAVHGYDAHTAAFFPLYPWLLGLAGKDLVLVAFWGVVISNLTFAAALVYLYRLTCLEYDKATARLAIWLMAFCPTAMYFSAVYSESLFLLWFVLTFWFLRRGNWALTGVCAFLAALTRQVGVLIFLALLIEWWQARRRGATSFRHLPVTLTPLLALGLWQLTVSAQVGDASQGLSSQQEYYRAVMWPWIPVWRDISQLFYGGVAPVLWLHLGATLAALLLVITSWKTQPLSYSMMTLGVLAMNFTLARTIPPYTLPVARYLMTMFPFIQRLSVTAMPFSRMRLNALLLIFLYLFVGALFAYRFGMKDFIG